MMHLTTNGQDGLVMENHAVHPRRFVRISLVATMAVAFGMCAPTAPKPVEEPSLSRGVVADSASPDGIVRRLGTPFHANVGDGHHPKFSPDGTRLTVLGYSDVGDFDIRTRSVRFAVKINPTRWWSSPWIGASFTDTGDLMAFWPGSREHASLVWRIAPDGSSSNYTIAEGKPGRLVDELPPFYDRQASEFSLSPNGTRLAINWSGIIKVYDVATGDGIAPRNLPPHWERTDPYSKVALSQDGRLLALGDRQNHRVFVVESGAEIDRWEFPPTQQALLWPVSFNRDGTRALAVQRSHARLPGAALIRDIQARTSVEVPGELVAQLGSAVLSPVGDRVALVPVSESEEPVVLWDVSAKKILHRLDGSARAIHATFSHDGRTLAVLDKLGVVSLWDVETGHLTSASADPPAAIRQLRYLDDGRQLAAFPGRWITWDLQTGQRTNRLAGAGRSHELSADGKLAARLEDDRLTVVEADTGKVRWSARLTGADRFTKLRFSPESARLVSRTREAVQVWDASSGQPLTAFPVLAGQYLLAVSPLARHVAISHIHPDIRSHNGDGREYYTVPAVYDTATGKPLWDSEPLVSESYPAMFSPDGQLLAYEAPRYTDSGGGPNGVVVREASTGRVLWQAKRRAAYAMAFSPDGRLLALGHQKGEIVIYEPRTGSVRGFAQRQAQITALTFSPDGKTLAAASPDAPVYLWDVSNVCGAPRSSNSP